MPSFLGPVTPHGILTWDKLEQPDMVFLSTLITPYEIGIWDKPAQRSNANSTFSVTPSGTIN